MAYRKASSPTAALNSVSGRLIKLVNIVDASLVLIVDLLIGGQRTVVESQNGSDWEGPLDIIMSKASAPAEPPRAGCSGPSSDGDEEGNIRYGWR